MRAVRITLIMTVVVMVTLAGCEAPSGSPQTSAPVTVYLHGRMDVGIGTFTH